MPDQPDPNPLRLLSVHAHPDDEASKGAPTIAKYRAEGILASLVCCTGGECGDVLNPAMDRPEVRERLAEVRRGELEASVAAIGYASFDMLGYRDSGMPDTADNARADNFWNAPLDEAVGRLVSIIRRDRPQVLITYGDDQRGYPHPDHLKVHDISLPAFERAGDPDWYPELGEPWQPSKMYYSTWSKARIVALHEGMIRLRGESPFDQAWLDRPGQDHRITTKLDIGDYLWARTGSLKAHATQVDPTEPWWFGLDDHQLREVYPYEDWILARSLVGTPAEGELETDLFAGVRDLAISGGDE